MHLFARHRAQPPCPAPRIASVLRPSLRFRFWLALVIGYSGVANFDWVIACVGAEPSEHLRSKAGAKLDQTLAGHPFLHQYCADCHSGTSAESGFDIEQLEEPTSQTSSVERWTELYDRVRQGEMPPQDGAQPSSEQVDDFLNLVRPALVRADRARRETVLRRLNRVEYQNTIEDLLQIDIDVTKHLPEDQSAGGFDTNGQALSLSTELLQTYLKTARLALDAAIVTRQRPDTIQFTTDAMGEVKRYLEKGGYGIDDDRIVVYTTPRGQYSKISSRSRRVPERGRYQIEFTAAAVHTDEPLVFMVTASDFGRSSEYQRLGFFEVGREPKRFTIEATLEKNGAVQYFALGLPKWIKQPALGEYPGVGFGPTTITGPLYPQWPPPSHENLIGTVLLDDGQLPDAQTILRRFMPRAYRRPVSKVEIERRVQLVRQSLGQGRSFQEALQLSLAAVLCSPDFLYLAETTEPDRPFIDDYELASRLSYFLWSSMPDEELFATAEAGLLSRPDMLRQQVERMLSDEKADEFVRHFVGQWLRLRDIDETTPDSKLYPEFDDLLRVGMVAEAEAFFRHLLDENLPVYHFIDSDFVMLNRRMAEHYGIDGAGGLQWKPYPVPDGNPRGGVLTMAGVLKVTANGTVTSPVLRGVWVLENILATPPPPPPPNVPGLEPDVRGATTIRDQLARHRDLPNCRQCHLKIDPPGFALEAFDPIGQYRRWYRTSEGPKVKVGGRYMSYRRGPTVDSSGVLSDGSSFQNVVEWKQLLLERKDEFAAALTSKLLAYGLGREVGFSDRPAITKIVADTRGDGNGLRDLIHAITQSETFRRH